MDKEESILNFSDEIYEDVLKNLKHKSKFSVKDRNFKIRSNLTIDARGSYGQTFLVEAIKKTGYRAKNDDDKNKD